MEINKSDNLFGNKMNEQITYNVDEFNTIEMKLFNDLKIIEDTFKLVNGGLNSEKKGHLFYEKIKVKNIFNLNKRF